MCRRAEMDSHLPLLHPAGQAAAGQSHLKLEEVIEYELKTGDDGMEERELRDLETIFAQVEDPRIERTKQHRLRDIIILAICGVICGADGWVGIEEFGKAKEAWLTDLLKLPNGNPSHDTPLDESLPSSIPNSLKRVFFNGCRGSAPPSKGSSPSMGRRADARMIRKQARRRCIW